MTVNQEILFRLKESKLLTPHVHKQCTREAIKINANYISLETPPKKKMNDYLKQPSSHAKKIVKNNFNSTPSKVRWFLSLQMVNMTHRGMSLHKSTSRFLPKPLVQQAN